MRQLIPLLASVATWTSVLLSRSDGWIKPVVGGVGYILWLWFIVLFEAWGLLLMVAGFVIHRIHGVVIWHRRGPPGREAKPA